MSTAYRPLLRHRVPLWPRFMRWLQEQVPKMKLGPHHCFWRLGLEVERGHEALLEAGADVNTQNLKGNTVLHLAIVADDTFIINFFLDRKQK